MSQRPESWGPIVPCNDIHIQQKFIPLFRRHCLDSLDGLFQPQIGEILSKPGLGGWRERIRLSLADESGRSYTFYLKRFSHPPRSLSRHVGNAAQARSVAEVEWNRLREFHDGGVPASVPVAFGHEFEDEKEIRSAVVMLAVPGESLESWMKRWNPQNRQAIRSLIQPLADLIGRMHRLRLIHRDLYLCHIFFDPGAASGDSLHLIDLQRVIRPRWLLHRWIVKDLAALNFSTPFPFVTTKDRIRWLKLYLDVRRLGRKEKRLIRQIMRKTKKIAAHDAKRRK
ncbi:MAG: hypothetical protein JXR73_03090 [Candidatus Omnitrophica bacterium]|nr:hypothetical protein [Candidatus Omnitrophota bacterium]